jgi:hypothetical protein
MKEDVNRLKYEVISHNLANFINNNFILYLLKRQWDQIQ